VSLSDSSAPAISPTIANLSGPYDNRFEISYRAASAGQTLTLRYLQETVSGNIILGAATLRGPGGVGVTLPFTDDFSDGDMSGWLVLDQTSTQSDWTVVGGSLTQNVPIRSTQSYDQSFQLGSYVYFGAGLGLGDYRFRVDAEYLAVGTADDIGILFRYRDAKNFYRLSINSRYGFTRLEKRVNGIYTPLRTDSRGYRRGEVLNLEVEVRGPQIIVWRSGEPVFALTDDSHASGSVALYTQDRARFDNVRIDPPSSAPSIVLNSPLAYLTSSESTIRASAVTLNAPVDAMVEFSLNGSKRTVDTAPPYAVDFAALTGGNYEVVAILRNGAGIEVARDTNPVVGAGGEYFVGIGDSITNGTGDFFSGDNVSYLGRIVGLQGYEGVLTDLLDQTSPAPTNLVFNEGIGGDTSYKAAFLRVDSIKGRHAGMDTALVQLGTNDALALIPSGLGCSGTSCNGTFKQNMQALVDKLVASAVEPLVALPPPAFNSTTPYTSATNTRIREYISVIENEITGIALGPDFFTFFMPSETVRYRSLFSDTLHPNGLGYRVMSYLWHNTLSPAAQLELPFLLRNLSLSTGKLVQQNLLGPGNAYYIDESFTLGSIPAILAEGRWIMTANADLNSVARSYVTFDVDRNADVYLAYDANATSLPGWLIGFVDTGEAVGTSNPSARSLRLYHKPVYVPSGTVRVTLGGNDGSTTTASSNYVVIVVEMPE
jgi:lysophospholipase L1-like esterase